MLPKNKFFVFLSKDGIIKIPAKNQSVKKKTSLIADSIKSVPEKFCETAMVESKTINKMATISSTIKAPNTMPANFLPLTLSSSKARKIIVVLDMDRIAPKNKLFMVLHPKNWPVI